MFKDPRGEISIEWGVLIVIAAAVVLVVVLGIANTTKSKGDGVNTWIGNLSTP